MRVFEDRAALAAALAGWVAAGVEARLARGERAAIAVSGGTTPILFLQRLAAQELDWGRVDVTWVADRWVGEASERSNGAMVRAHLLRGAARGARFLPLMNGASSPEAGRAAVEAAVGALGLPFAAVVLGMGMDGHTASFFPGGDRLDEALAPATGRLVETMRAEGALEARITFTLPALVEADRVAIHIEGMAKRGVLEAAMKPGPAEAMPIRAVLARRPEPEVFWSP